MKEFSKEKEYKKIRNPKRNIVILSVSLFLLGILSIFIYKSYALFKINSEHVIINGVVGSFYTGGEFIYTGDSQEFIVPITGYYDVELWGAGGGIRDYFSPSVKTKGGYTKGTIYLEKDESLYFYVGNDGGIAWTDISAAPAAYNGGSVGGFSHCENGAMCPATYLGGGGGATDVRIISGSWNDSTSLRSRIMVAGAGGGGGGYANLGNDGVGGGLIAASGGLQAGSCFNGIVPASSGIGGTQTTGHAFGYGGNGAGNMVAGGGGGSGYYGGTGGNGSPSCASYNGGGGSSYISGYAGVNSVTSATSTVHTNNTIHYSGKYFLNGSMESGVNTGNGKAKISLVGTTIPAKTNVKLNSVRYIKSCASGNNIDSGCNWVEIQAIKDGVNVAKGKSVSGNVAQNNDFPYTNIVDGNISVASRGVNGSPSVLSCITIDLGATYDLDEIATWHSYGGGQISKDNILSIGGTNIGGSTSLSTILHNYAGTTGGVNSSQGRRYTAWN